MIAIISGNIYLYYENYLKLYLHKYYRCNLKLYLYLYYKCGFFKKNKDISSFFLKLYKYLYYKYGLNTNLYF